MKQEKFSNKINNVEIETPLDINVRNFERLNEPYYMTQS